MPGLDLPAIARDFLGARNAQRSGPTADAAALSALLAERGYRAHSPVLAFEAAYGGLRLIDADPETPTLVVGAYANLSPGSQHRHESPLVPVIFAIDDVVYSLDEEGRGWACATMVEGVARPTARDGRQLLTQAILWRAMAALPHSLQHKVGRHGESVARELGLGPITDASSEHERWWGDLDRLVVEIERGNGYPTPMTYVAAPVAPSPRASPGDLCHQAIILDLGQIPALQSLVSSCIESGDDSGLQEFARSHALAKRLRDDSKSTRLEPQALSAILAQIASIASSPLAETETGKRLLQAGRALPTHERNVAKNALEKLMIRAGRLQKLVDLHAPPPIVESEAPLVLSALEALDGFDLSTRGRSHEEPAPTAQSFYSRSRLVRECLLAMMVDDAEPIGTGADTAARTYIEGPVVFPRPMAPAALPTYEALFGSFDPEGQPRMAEGRELSSTLLRVQADSDARDDQDSNMHKGPLARYARGLSFAIEHGHGVVEWITPSSEG